MSHYTITLGFESDNEAEAMEIVQAIAKEAGKVIRSFDRYMEIDGQDTKAVKDYSPEERTDRIAKIIDIYHP